MSKMEQYIKKVEEFISKNKDLTEMEIIRYVYLDLGKRFSFNLNFAFGNSKTKKEIYRNSKSTKALEEAMEEDIIICKSISYILEFILRKFGIDIITVVDDYDERACPHMYNIVTPKEGEKYIIDLQEDLENIQSHSFTKYFGVSVEEKETMVIDRKDIENIDRKLGYIDDKNYYADDYLYLLKSYMNYFTDLAKKAEFVLENLEIYESSKMEYAERKWHHEKILEELFSAEELRKMHMIDCYKIIEGKKQYKNCIAVDVAGSSDIYMYSIEESKYCKMTLQEFGREIQNGLVNLQSIQGLKTVLKKLKNNDQR